MSSTPSETVAATNVATQETAQQKPDCMLMIYNVGKPANVGNMIRSAVAFGASTIVLVGNRRLNRFGNQSTEEYLKEIHYETIEEAKADLHSKNYTIVGIEIGESSVDVTTHPFTGNTVFMFGNEGQGMNEKQYELCDKLVYIPQYGKGTASLNVSNAAAIIFHHFALWAGYQQQTIVEAKFLVDASAKATGKRTIDGQYQYTEHELNIRAKRQARKQTDVVDSAPEVETSASTPTVTVSVTEAEAVDSAI